MGARSPASVHSPAMLLILPLLWATTVDAYGMPPPQQPIQKPGFPQMPQFPSQPSLPPVPPCTWLEWSACDKSCNGGVTFRTRIITSECPYGPSHQAAACNTQPCPQDCVLSPWTEWTCGAGCCGCSAPCGGGVQSRMRKVLAPALFGGQCNEETVQSQACNTQSCPVDCVVTSMWSGFGACSSGCGGGYQNRTRSVDFIPVTRTGSSHTRKDCPSFFEERSCNNQPCPVDCVLGQWTEWTECVTSDTPSFRWRQVEVYPQNNGLDCDGMLLQSRPCGPSNPPEKQIPQRPQIPQVPQFPQEPQFPQVPQRPQPSIQVPIIVKPSPSAVPPFVSAPPSKQDPTFCASRDDGGYSKPGCRCCRDFIYCFQRTVMTKWCPPGEVWDEDFGKCMDATDAGCSKQ